MDGLNNIEQRLSNIERLLLADRKVLSFAQAVEYTGISASYLYKLTSARIIRHFKPLGKLIYFAREDLDAWMLSRPIKTRQEINQEAINYVTTGKKINSEATTFKNYGKKKNI